MNLKTAKVADILLRPSFSYEDTVNIVLQEHTPEAVLRTFCAIVAEPQLRVIAREFGPEELEPFQKALEAAESLDPEAIDLSFHQVSKACRKLLSEANSKAAVLACKCIRASVKQNADQAARGVGYHALQAAKLRSEVAEAQEVKLQKAILSRLLKDHKN